MWHQLMSRNRTKWLRRTDHQPLPTPKNWAAPGRCMADFAWGLQQRGHTLQVLSSDAPYLGPSSAGPSDEPVGRQLQLKGSFKGGVHQLQEPTARAAVDANNRALLAHWLGKGSWDGVLIGNLDLLGTELLAPLLASGLPLLHHIGFVTPPYPPEQMPPKNSRYQVLAASAAVRGNAFMTPAWQLTMQR